MARRYSAYSGAGGESFVTDEERMGADAARTAAIQALRGGQQQQQMPEPGPQFLSENDLRNRTINKREQDERLLMTAGDQDRQTLLAGDIGKNYRTDVQHKAGIMGAEDNRSLQQEGMPIREAASARTLQALQSGGNPEMDQWLMARSLGVGDEQSKFEERQHSDKLAREQQLAALLPGLASSPMASKRGLVPGIAKSLPAFADMPDEDVATITSADPGALAGMANEATAGFVARPDTQNKIARAAAVLAQQLRGDTDPYASSLRTRLQASLIAQQVAAEGGDPQQAVEAIEEMLTGAVKEAMKKTQPVYDTGPRLQAPPPSAGGVFGPTTR